MKKIYSLILLAVCVSAFGQAPVMQELTKNHLENLAPYSGTELRAESVNNSTARACEDTLFYHFGDTYWVNPNDSANYGRLSSDLDGFELHSVYGGGKDSFQLYQSNDDGNIFFAAYSFFADTVAAAGNAMYFLNLTIPEGGAKLMWKHKYNSNDYRDAYSVLASKDGLSWLKSFEDGDTLTYGDTVWTEQSIDIDQDTLKGETISFVFFHTGLLGLGLNLDDIVLVGCDGTVTSVASLEEASFKVYPNPTSNFINVEISNVNNAIEIFDVIGNRVYLNTNPTLVNTINVSGFAKGIYTVRSGNTVERVIVK